jgi:hypothetical protein
VEAAKIKFLADALYELKRTFHLLKWSYCLTYFCKNGKEKWLFVEQQVGTFGCVSIVSFLCFVCIL